MSKPEPPCSRDCPRRRASPNCHNRDYCREWGLYEDADAAWKVEQRKAIAAERDVEGSHKSSYRRYLRLTGMEHET